MSLRVTVVGDDLAAATAALRAVGLEIVRREPDVVVCHGGDGTLLRAERLFAGVPKCPARLGRKGHPCPRHGLSAIARRLAAGELETERLDALELEVGRVRFRALNDVVLRNGHPGLALRLRVGARGALGEEVSGDGVVIATPFGSSGYWRSITRRSFDRGFGVAYNNATQPAAAFVLPPESEIELVVVRGQGVLVCDNDARLVGMRDGHRTLLRRAPQPATVLGLDALRCQECRKADGCTYNPHSSRS